MAHNGQPNGYEAPRMELLGTVQELTAACDKTFGSSDSYTFMGQSIVCTSA